MIEVSSESCLDLSELVEFLINVDNYFQKPLSLSCNQPTLQIWGKKLLTQASFITARNTDNKIVGCLIYYRNAENEFAFVNILAVLKEYQGLGIAQKIFHSLFIKEKIEKRLGVRLLCRANNLPAMNCYKKVGFFIEESCVHIEGFITLTYKF